MMTRIKTQPRILDCAPCQQNTYGQSVRKAVKRNGKALVNATGEVKMLMKLL